MDAFDEKTELKLHHPNWKKKTLKTYQVKD